jgi:hypothetical protein
MATLYREFTLRPHCNLPNTRKYKIILDDHHSSFDSRQLVVTNWVSNIPVMAMDVALTMKRSCMKLQAQTLQGIKSAIFRTNRSHNLSPVVFHGTGLGRPRDKNEKSPEREIKLMNVNWL